MTEFDIQLKLYDFLNRQNRKCIVLNIYIGWGECDVFCLTQNNYAHEFEIKISRSDYFNDFKKIAKHNLLSGKFKPSKNDRRTLISHFWYVVPDGLIKLDEVPEYAGLIYISHRVEVKREAPKLPLATKISLEKENYILRGCYYRMWNLMKKLKTGVQPMFELEFTKEQGEG